MTNLAVLASGEGTNLQVLLDECAAGRIPGRMRVVLSDRESAPALRRAKNAGVEALFVPAKGFSSREDYDRHLVSLLREREVEWVALAGFMRILSPAFVQAFARRILNIHPSLLPAYPGVRSIERAFSAGEKQVGVTVHFVDEGVDTGPIVMQEGVPVMKSDTLDTLTARVHETEHRIYPEALRRALGGAK